MKISEMIDKYIEEDFKYADALARTCLDIILSKIDKANFSEHITIKGGVAIMNISKDVRRTTRDLDLDFIKYSLSDESIRVFIKKLDSVNDGIGIEIKGNIEELRQQDYKGKRVIVTINDNSNIKYDFKLDLGVHVNLDLEQDEVFFDLNNYLDSVTILVNSKEQIMSEKLKSLLMHGDLSTRFKDIYDMYYLTHVNKINTNIFKGLIKDYILDDNILDELEFKDIYNSLVYIFTRDVFRKNIENKKEDNWLELPTTLVLRELLNFFKEIK